MKILAFDTSSSSGSIALMEDGRLLGELNAVEVSTHSEWLLPSIDGFLKKVGVDISSVDVLAITTGPGAFTGLRIGVSVAKGLGWALKKKIIGVSALEAMARNIRHFSKGILPENGRRGTHPGNPLGERVGMGLVCPIIDARRKEVYAALFKFQNNKFERVSEDCCMTPEKLLEFIKFSRGKSADQTSQAGDPIVFLGNGINVYGDLLRAVPSSIMASIMAPKDLWAVRASVAADIAFENLDSAVSPDMLAPVYLRKSEAELKA